MCITLTQIYDDGFILSYAFNQFNLPLKTSPNDPVPSLSFRSIINLSSITLMPYYF